MTTVTALGLAAAGAVFVAVTKQASPRGAAAGFVVAAVCVWGLGAGALAPLATFVLGGGALTKLGGGRKRAMGVQEHNEGRRGASHVAAKLALPAFVAAVAGLTGLTREFAVAYSAGLAGAFADTAGTEVGPLGRGAAFGFRGGRLVRLEHGTAGAVSFVGLVATILAAAAVAITALAAGLVTASSAAVFVAAAGLAAAVFESLLAPTSAGRGIGHFGRNVFVSAVATALGLGLGFSTMGMP